MAARVKVMMVDDEERFRTTTAKILERKGLETIVADSGEQALEKLSEKPDVVVLDIRMKGMSGHETLKRIKETSPNLPVIMLTGHGDSDSAQECLKIGAFDYLSKPADSNVLHSKIQEAYAYGKTGTKPGEKSVAELMIRIEEYAIIPPTATVKQAVIALREASANFMATDRLMQTGHRSVLVMDRDTVLGVMGAPELFDAVRPPYLSDESYRSQAAVTTWQFSRIFWSGLFTARLKEIAERPVSELMVDAPPGIQSDANLMEAADTLHEQGVRRLLVFSGERVVGVLREQELFFEMVSILSKA